MIPTNPNSDYYVAKDIAVKRDVSEAYAVKLIQKFNEDVVKAIEKKIPVKGKVPKALWDKYHL